jgi:hypothetical protein
MFRIVFWDIPEDNSEQIIVQFKEQLKRINSLKPKLV